MLLKKPSLNSFKMPFILAVFCVLLYFWFAYFLERTEFIKLIVLYSALFFLFYKLVQLLKPYCNINVVRLCF
jgi:ABC-type spermidine/putrescine transport system permease subunit I